MHQLLLLFILLLTACAQQTVGTKKENSTTKINYVKGMKIYQENCTACHGDNGTGSFAGVPNLTRIAGFDSKSDSADVLNKHFDHVKNGLKVKGDPMAMPPKGGNPNLTDQDIREVLKYMHEKFTQK